MRFVTPPSPWSCECVDLCVDTDLQYPSYEATYHGFDRILGLVFTCCTVYIPVFMVNISIGVFRLLHVVKTVGTFKSWEIRRAQRLTMGFVFYV